MAHLMTALILRNGCRTGMRSSRLTSLNSDPLALSEPRIATSVFTMATVNHVPRGAPGQTFFSRLLDHRLSIGQAMPRARLHDNRGTSETFHLGNERDPLI